jgi:hypothetical protein
MKTPLEQLLQHLKENNLHIWDEEERLADEEDFIFDFINKHFKTITREEFYEAYESRTND